MRLWQLDASDFTFDEVATYTVAHRPLLDILAYLRGAVREHPPLYYLLVRLWMGLVGASEYGLRFFAVGASMLGIALTARLARTLARRLNVTGAVELTGFVSALVLALFPCEVYYARDARMYTLVIVWTTLSSLQFLRLLCDQEESEARRPVVLAGLVLVNALGLFTHYYLALLIVTQFVSLLLLRRWRSSLAWAAAHGLVGLVGVFWLVRSPGLADSLAEAWGRFVPTWPSAGQLRRILAGLLFGPITGVPWTLVYAWGLLVLLGLLVAWRRSRSMGTWLAGSVLVPVALAFLMPEPPRPRYLIFILPFAALALGQLPALATRGRVQRSIWLGMSALAVSILGLYGLPRTVTWVKSSYGHTIATVSAHARPGDGVLFYGPWQWPMFRYYQPDEFPPVTVLPPRAPPQLVPQEAEPVLQELLATYQRLWVIPAAVDDVDPAHFVEGWLDTHAHPVWTTRDFSLYLPPPAQDGLSVPVEFTFGDRLRLERVTADSRSVPAGESLRLTLTWVLSEPLAGDVKLRLALVDEGHYLWREWETVPGRWLSPPSTWSAGDVITNRQGLIVPPGAPPGPFTLQLTVIDADSGAPLPVVDTDGPRSLPGVDLLTFDVGEPVLSPVLLDFADPVTFECPDGAAETVTLAGYWLGGSRFQPGYPVPLRLHWLAPLESVPELELRLQLWQQERWSLLGGPRTAVATESMPLIPVYPVTDWPAGRLVSLLTAVPIPVDVPPGRADLTLALLDHDGRPCTVAGSQRLHLGTLTVEARPMLRRLPRGLTAVQVDFGDQIGLRGYRIDGEARPGGQLELTYAWYALRRPDRQYAVFNHLLTADGQKIAQVDGWPQDPQYGQDTTVVLTKQWRPGEYVPDSHTLEIPADAPRGPYLLAVGLYDVGTVERLRAFQGGEPLPNDQWLLPVDEGSQ